MGRGGAAKRRSRELKERRRGGPNSQKNQGSLSKAVTTAILSVQLASTKLEAETKVPINPIYENPIPRQVKKSTLKKPLKKIINPKGFIPTEESPLPIKIQKVPYVLTSRINYDLENISEWREVSRGYFRRLDNDPTYFLITREEEIYRKENTKNGLPIYRYLGKFPINNLFFPPRSKQSSKDLLKKLEDLDFLTEVSIQDVEFPSFPAHLLNKPNRNSLDSQDYLC